MYVKDFAFIENIKFEIPYFGDHALIIVTLLQKVHINENKIVTKKMSEQVFCGGVKCKNEQTLFYLLSFIWESGESGDMHMRRNKS